MQQLEYYTKHVYGNPLLYLVPTEQGKAIGRLIGKKTIDAMDVHNLQILGYTLIEVLPPKQEAQTSWAS